MVKVEIEMDENMYNVVTKVLSLSNEPIPISNWIDKAIRKEFGHLETIYGSYLKLYRSAPIKQMYGDAKLGENNKF